MNKNDLTGRVLTITRLIHAPRLLVFEMFTNPNHVKHWWGPNGFTNTIHKMDFRPGGTWEFIMHGPDGTDFKNVYRYNEIIPGERIQYTHSTGPVFEATIILASQGNDTLVTLTSVFESAEQLKKVIEVFKADEGMKQHIQRLEDYVTKLISKTL